MSANDIVDGVALLVLSNEIDKEVRHTSARRRIDRVGVPRPKAPMSL